MIRTILSLSPVKTLAMAWSRASFTWASSAVRGYCSLMTLGKGSRRLKCMFFMVLTSFLSQVIFYTIPQSKANCNTKSYRFITFLLC